MKKIPGQPLPRHGGNLKNTTGSIGKDNSSVSPSDATAGKEIPSMESKLNYGTNPSGISTRKAS